MATVLNLSNVMNKVLENCGCYADNETSDTSVNSLIFLNAEKLRTDHSISFQIIINEDPKIVCSFSVYVVNSLYYVRISVNFSPNVPDTFRYQLNLYYINSQMKLGLLEVLNVDNVTEKSTFNFMNERLQIFTSLGSGARGLMHSNLINNHLCLYCEITRKDTIIPLEVKIPENEMARQFYSLYEDKTLTDFKIICKDNKEFLVHKVVLAARSPVFKAMFEHELQESQKNEVQISDFQSDIVEQTLHYIYTDNIENLNEENKEAQLEALLGIADKYGLKKLKLLCMNEISKSVSNVPKVLDAISIADNYNVTEFKEMAVEFIRNNRHNL